MVTISNIDSRGVSKKRKLMMSRWRHRKHLTDSAMLSRRELESRAMRSCVAFSVVILPPPEDCLPSRLSTLYSLLVSSQDACPSCSRRCLHGHLSARLSAGSHGTSYHCALSIICLCLRPAFPSYHCRLGHQHGRPPERCRSSASVGPS